MAYTRKPTSSEKTWNKPEYHLNVRENNGLLIAGSYNNITTKNVYKVLMIESPRNDSNNDKKRSQKRHKKKNKSRQESAESDCCERSRKTSESAKSKNSANNSPRKEKESKEDQARDERSKYLDDNHAEESLKDQDFVTTSEDESTEFSKLSARSGNGHLLTQDEDKRASIPCIGFRNFDKIPENESESASQGKKNNTSGDLFSPLKVALRQAICFAACIIFCLYFEVLSFLPFMLWLVFIANNLLACFSCIKFTFETIDFQEMPALERPFIAIARLQVDFFIKEENILQRLFALLLIVSLAFVSSQVFGCAACLLMQTIVVTLISTIPYLLFENNSLVPFPLTEHCRVFKPGIHSSGNVITLIHQ